MPRLTRNFRRSGYRIAETSYRLSSAAWRSAGGKIPRNAVRFSAERRHAPLFQRAVFALLLIYSRGRDSSGIQLVHPARQTFRSAS